MVWDWQTITALIAGAAGILAALIALLNLFRKKKQQQEQEGGSGEPGDGQQGQGQEGQGEGQQPGEPGDSESEAGEGPGKDEEAEAKAEAERLRQEAEDLRRQAEEQRKERERIRLIEEAEAREREARERELKLQRIAAIREAVRTDPELAKMLFQMAQVHEDPKDVSASAEKARELAERLNPQFIEMMRVGANQQIVDLDLRSTERQVPVNYPTRNMSIEPIDDLGQIPELDPVELMKPDDQFYEDLALKKMNIPRYTATERDESLGYLLMDGSGSMERGMQNGMPRHVTARGVALNLLMRAKRGKSKYFLRMFDASPHELQMATDKKEVEAVIQFVLNQGFSGGDTNIRRAIETAVNDIKTLGGDIANAELVLISDGEDSSINDVDYMKQVLGEVRLHVCMIGMRNPALQAIATTYREIL